MPWTADAANSLLAALQPTLSLEGQARTIANPIGISGLPDPEEGVVGAVLTGLFIVVGLATSGSLVLRFGRARGEERRQLKWVAYAAGLMVVATVVGGTLLPGGSDLVVAVTVALVPAAAGIAILRYRLYDIDRIINRILVYGWLTAIRKYDAAKTVEAFTIRLRDEVDLDMLSAELLAVVHQTIQPTRASLWIRSGAR